MCFWFLLEKVLFGLFEIVICLFGVMFEMDSCVDVYYNDVCFYCVYWDGEVIVGFYLDFYVCVNKWGGVWMDVCCLCRCIVVGEL